MNVRCNCDWSSDVCSSDLVPFLHRSAEYPKVHDNATMVRIFKIKYESAEISTFILLYFGRRNPTDNFRQKKRDSLPRLSRAHKHAFFVTVQKCDKLLPYFRRTRKRRIDFTYHRHNDKPEFPRHGE